MKNIRESLQKKSEAKREANNDFLKMIFYSHAKKPRIFTRQVLHF